MDDSEEEHNLNNYFQFDGFYNIDDQYDICENIDCQEIMLDEFETFFNTEKNKSSSALNKKNLLAPPRKAKRKVSLSQKAKELKKEFYSIFTSRKVFQKKFLFEIHDKLISPKLGEDRFPKSSREERRRRDKYFEHYENEKDEILQFLEDNKKVISETTLKDIKDKKI